MTSGPIDVHSNVTIAEEALKQSSVKNLHIVAVNQFSGALPYSEPKVDMTCLRNCK